MERRPRISLLVFAAWTLLVWTGRVYNVSRSTELDSSEKVGALVRPVVFVAIGLAAAWVAFKPRFGTPLARRSIVMGGAGLTIVLWLVDAVLITARDHTVGFKVVHAVLAVVSIALASWALRSELRGESTPTGSDGPDFRPAADMANDLKASAEEL